MISVHSELVSRLKSSTRRIIDTAGNQPREADDSRSLLAIRTLGLKPDIKRVLPEPS